MITTAYLTFTSQFLGGDHFNTLQIFYRPLAATEWRQKFAVVVTCSLASLGHGFGP